MSAIGHKRPFANARTKQSREAASAWMTC